VYIRLNWIRFRSADALITSASANAVNWVSIAIPTQRTETMTSKAPPLCDRRQETRRRKCPTGLIDDPSSVKQSPQPNSGIDAY
jgi:hypothetical protein